MYNAHRQAYTHTHTTLHDIHTAYTYTWLFYMSTTKFWSVPTTLLTFLIHSHFHLNRWPFYPSGCRPWLLSFSPIPQQILLIVPSKYIQNQTNFSSSPLLPSWPSLHQVIPVITLVANKQKTSLHPYPIFHYSLFSHWVIFFNHESRHIKTLQWLLHSVKNKILGLGFWHLSDLLPCY